MKQKVIFRSYVSLLEGNGNGQVMFHLQQKAKGIKQPSKGVTIQGMFFMYTQYIIINPTLQLWPFTAFSSYKYVTNIL